MKKKVLSILAVSMLFGSVVSAASIWGTYKGNQVIRITSNGSALRTDDVPAISYNGRTMIPINMLGQIGVQYKWDQKNQTVEVSTSNKSINEQPSPNNNEKLSDYARTADYFYELQILGQFLSTYSNSFYTAFNYAYMSTPDMKNAMKILEQVDYALETTIESYNYLNSLASSYNDASINSILTNYYNSIEAIKETRYNIEQLFSDKTTTKFNAFSKSNSEGSKYALSGMGASRNKYKEYINKIK